MGNRRIKVTWLTVVVVIFAADLALFIATGNFRGIYLLALAMQACSGPWWPGNPGARRFRRGFLASGCVMIAAFLAWRRLMDQAVIAWPAFLYRSYRDSLPRLSPESTGWLLTHVWVPDPNGELSTFEGVEVFEFCYGLPMLLLGSMAGLACGLAPRPRPRGPSPEAPGVSPR